VTARTKQWTKLKDLRFLYIPNLKLQREGSDEKAGQSEVLYPRAWSETTMRRQGDASRYTKYKTLLLFFYNILIYLLIIIKLKVNSILIFEINKSIKIFYILIISLLSM
jgi:hypothetical protein